MAEPFSHPLWPLWLSRRKQQLFAGKISAFFFLLAVLALADGLQTLVRTDTNEIVLLAGQSDGVSGPCPLQNPVTTDLQARFSPSDTELRFELEGFFAGYLIGNGMWRGQVLAPHACASSEATLLVTFQGTPQGQKFHIRVFATEEDLRAHSPSLLYCHLGMRPFVLAACFAVVALLPALFTLVLGRKNLNLLQQLHLAEIFRVQDKVSENGSQRFLWCADYGESLKIGQALSVFSAEGDALGQAVVVSQNKRVLCLSMSDTSPVSSGCLVQLHHPST